MGDRTYCNLNVRGKITADQLVALESRIATECQAAETLPGSGWWGFSEVNYADPEQENLDLQMLADEFGVTFIWSWDAGCDYGPGINFFAPEQPMAGFAFNGDEIAVAVNYRDPVGTMQRLTAAFEYSEIWNGKMEIVETEIEAAA